MHPILAFGPLGSQEMIVIFVIILLLFGAKKIPELARGLGKSMGEFKKAREDFEREITRAEDDTRIDKTSGKSTKDNASFRHTEDETRIKEAAGKEPVDKV